MKEDFDKKREFYVGFFCTLAVMGTIAAALLLVLNL